ncbi:MAG: DUF389 domain-containing protein [Acidimicrobiia bacterium]|nr:DUF389 domain-containing protein [Acidimicrobiia bacterium]
MRTQPQLRKHERARVVDQVGTAGPASAAAAMDDPDNLVEMLAAAAPVEDDDHWMYTPEQRYRILQTLLMADGSPWVARYGFLLAMSILIASLGLANDQPAAVIAAMVVAPMMTPVLGIAASLVLGLVRRTIRLVAIVIASSAFAVAFGWLISSILVVHEVTAEELSRTTPRLRDLVIALAAGAAGMYSIVRKDLSGVVPGVAIAVALVPPLATIGIVLELEEWSLARGAALLYLVNVIAIIFAALVVLLVTDFITSPRLRDTKVMAAAAILVVVSIAIIVPVRHNSRRIDREVTFRTHAADSVGAWTDTHPEYVVVDEQIAPGQVTLVFTGPAEPPELDQLASQLATDDFPDPVLDVQWLQSIVADGPNT